MPTYVATVRDSKKPEKVEANSLAEAKEKLMRKGLVVQDLKESKSFQLPDFGSLLAKITVKELAMFSRQFSAMFNAGVPMVRCLAVLTDQCTNAKLKKALTQISADVNEGVSLADSLRKHPDCFDGLYVAMVESGETGGILDEVLNRVAKILEDSVRLQNQIKSASAYPKMVGGLAVVIFIAMTTFLLPIFAKIFEDLGMELPALTMFMLAISKFLRGPTLPDPERNFNIFIGIAAVMGAIWAYKQYYKTPAGRWQIDKAMLKLPIVGELIRTTAVARFCRIFGMLTRSGVPMLTSMEIVRDTAGNVIVATAIEDARKEVEQGGMISIALQRSNVFPVLAIQMMSIGEETGELDKMLLKLAEFYEDEVEQAVKGLTSMLEPLMMVGIAGMVGMILLSMYLPMFKVMDGIG
ncbi:type II secretion system F family protein [Planktothrix sp. FACHB-1355]|uniref:Type II secretion system F family protein n=1 Tax=Aerosakkonema funiforme FACHB-1375 TaxID=2949571 RepID=A0A926VGD2_9CYAN|nr:MULTISPECIES: type II secretion system F family protein [Oscillatoriales]MBD2182658.1 type II secretion system F family protein [Aerosakkonema funiforme FACHB-1375]MBD3558364.1 type II secretion system F family protein [Planktothrix sp. FACHB-1355]